MQGTVGLRPGASDRPFSGAAARGGNPRRRAIVRPRGRRRWRGIGDAGRDRSRATAGQRPAEGHIEGHIEEGLARSVACGAADAGVVGEGERHRRHSPGPDDKHRWRDEDSLPGYLSCRNQPRERLIVWTNLNVREVEARKSKRKGENGRLIEFQFSFVGVRDKCAGKGNQGHPLQYLLDRLRLGFFCDDSDIHYQAKKGRSSTL